MNLLERQQFEATLVAMGAEYDTCIPTPHRVHGGPWSRTDYVSMWLIYDPILVVTIQAFGNDDPATEWSVGVRELGDLQYVQSGIRRTKDAIELILRLASEGRYDFPRASMTGNLR